MKKLIVVIFTLAMLLAFVGCNKTENKLEDTVETDLNTDVVSAWYDCGDSDYLINYTKGVVIQYSPNCEPRVVSHDIKGFIKWYKELNH